MESASKCEFGIGVSQGLIVPLRDGTKLVADVYRPTLPNGEFAPCRFPTILGRTSYDRKNPVLWVNQVANFFCPRGFVVVLQDVRGRGDSEGKEYYHTSNPNEGRDGYDTIEWVAQQHWSNGKVGTVGSSHDGIVQNAAAIYRPPHLTAIWVDVAPTSAFDWEARQGGAMALQMFCALFLHAQQTKEVRQNAGARAAIINAAKNMRSLLWQAPAFEAGLTPLSVTPCLEEVLIHYCRDGVWNDWWGMDAVDQKHRFHLFPDIPAVFSTGWFDPYCPEVIEQFVALSRQNSSPQNLVVGAWNHSTMRDYGYSFTGEVEFGKGAGWGNEIYNRERLRWFDRWLKDVQNGVEHVPTVRIFTMGGGSGEIDGNGRICHGGRWRTAAKWPLPDIVQIPYFLGADGQLTADAPAGDAGHVSWIHDPSNPVPTIGGNVCGLIEYIDTSQLDQRYLHPFVSLKPIVPMGPMHQKAREGYVACKPPFDLLSKRGDVRVFQTRPFEEDIEVTGAMTVTLWVSSSTLDTDFTVKLVDVYPVSPEYPEGFHLLLADSILRARFRSGFDKEELLVPEAIYEITIPLPPISNVFKAGHRLRVDIASSNFPRFDINPNTGEPLGRHTHQIMANNKVFFGFRYPSRIELPVARRLA